MAITDMIVRQVSIKNKGLRGRYPLQEQSGGGYTCSLSTMLCYAML